MKKRMMKNLVLGICVVSILLSPFGFIFSAYADSSPRKIPALHFASEKKIYDFRNRTVKDSTVWFNTKVDSKIKEIWFSVKKGSNSCDYFASEINGKLNTSIFLPFGPGTYIISIYEKSNLSSEDYYSYKVLKVMNTDPTINLCNQTIKDSKLVISMPIEKELQEILIEVTKGTKKTDFIAKNLNGRIEKTIYFPFGKGSYNVNLYKSKTADTELYDDGQLEFQVNNGDERDMEFLLPSDDVESDNPEILDMAKEITKNCTNDMEKSKAIHDWVAMNISYDAKNFFSEKIKAYSAMETLHGRLAVCNGYAKLTAALHRALGIKARVIEGITFDPDKGETYDSVAGRESNHNWNEIFIDGKWIILDTTWDAGSVNDTTQSFTFDFQEKYFNPSSDDFSKDHRRVGMEDMRK